MKKMKRFMSLVLALVLAMAMGITAFAQTKAMSPANEDNATITINNPAKGETYTIYKLFDATVSEDGEQIAYQGVVPSGLDAFFGADAEGYIHAKESISKETDADGNIISTKMTDELKAALETWAGTVTATATEVSNGDATLEFTGLPYGYYVITTTNIDGDTAKAAITVDSTKPDATIYDKNVNEPSANKEVEKDSYSIGDTVKYTGTFDTTNFIGEAEDSRQVINYEISDTLPEYLSDVTVTSITIGGVELKINDEVPQFVNKKIMIQWATKEGDVYQNIYAQGAQIIIEYEATLTSTTNINEDDKNTITIQPYVDNGPGTPEGGDPWDETWHDDAVIRTYAAAIKKVDEEGNALAGAQFTIQGLVAEKTAEDVDGVYTVVSYNADSTEAGTVLSTDDQGMLYIVGFAKDAVPVVTEYKAPDGYNKLLETKILNVQIMTEEIFTESGTRHYDEDGNLVSEESTYAESRPVEKNLSDLDENALEIINNKGTLLPSTGGIGTTIFYVVGAVLVIGAGVLLVTKKRMSAR